jgi:hypothetical protein
VVRYFHIQIIISDFDQIVMHANISHSSDDYLTLLVSVFLDGRSMNISLTLIIQFNYSLSLSCHFNDHTVLSVCLFMLHNVVNKELTMVSVLFNEVFKEH